MGLQIENCIVADQGFSAVQVQELLQYPFPVTAILLDIQLLAQKMNRLGQEYFITQYLSGKEQKRLREFSSEKRKKEWLSGRIAAKHAAVRLLEQSSGYQNNSLHWHDYSIIADENGRPSLAVNNDTMIHMNLPDISISHSASMAAAMAVGKGFCGIDIQKIVPKVIKVQERFCSPAEKQILQAYFCMQPEEETAALAKLWAAKEALRKVSNLKSLPGFMELELVAIQKKSPHGKSASWVFTLSWEHTGDPATNKHHVAITLVKDYALALTASDDTVR